MQPAQATPSPAWTLPSTPFLTFPLPARASQDTQLSVFASHLQPPKAPQSLAPALTHLLSPLLQHQAT